MFTSILRIGPLVILEGMLVAIGLVIYFFEALPLCYVYTLTQLAFIFFLIEMYAALRLMKKSPKLRRRYLKGRIEGTKTAFYCRLVWDNLNIILVIMVLYSALVADGLRLSTSERTMEPSKDAASEECEFKLFSICLFSEMLKQCSFSAEDSMIVWMLYAATAFLISIIALILAREYYQYCASLRHNRRYYLCHGTINDALLDCNVYRISTASTLDASLRDTLGECSICLDGLLQGHEASTESKIIKLSCRHHFHEECIQKWLKVSENCPYRCFTDDK